ncbi:Hypothetical_protein [Hexamita inflata]|uniref:Hypothetical_protein n=1 Tax=Hexamita inflata TaxID=28002 RepID=A0AA86TK18_9EUKA|nr:Hypothetical protein HINF_LOCUS7380 [Hexamita inflata]
MICILPKFFLSFLNAIVLLTILLQTRAVHLTQVFTESLMKVQYFHYLEKLMKRIKNLEMIQYLQINLLKHLEKLNRTQKFQMLTLIKYTCIYTLFEENDMIKMPSQTVLNINDVLKCPLDFNGFRVETQ